MSIYVTLEQMKGKENKNLINVLNYIARKEGYMEGEKVQYKILYYLFLRERFLKTAYENNIDDFKVSITQYRRLKVYRKGKISIHTAVYLLTLYEIMYNYKKKADIGKSVKDISYTTYIVNNLKKEINDVLSLPGVPKALQLKYQKIYTDFIDLDNKTGNNKFKIYNNIW